MKIYHRISALITVCTMFLATDGYTTAVAEDQTLNVSSDSVEFQDSLILYEPIDESSLIPIEAAMNDCRLLNYIDEEQFESSKFVYRLPTSEDLNSYVFVNDDGDKVVYIMDENTKFIDSNGEVVEKDLTLSQLEDGFGIAKNDIKVLLPYDLSNGITMDYQGYAINILPCSLSENTMAEEVDGSVAYKSALSDNVSLLYTPLLSGIKENIVLSSYVSDAQYDFILKTNGLSALCEEGNWYLTSDDSSSEKFAIGNVEIYDAVGKPGIGSLDIEETEIEGEYIVHIMADDDYLSDETTTYPVIIDPTITVSDNTHGSNSIVDAPIFAGYPTSNFGGFVYDRVGTPSTVYGVGRTVVKLTGLTNTSDYQNVIADQITDVKFYAREAVGGASQYINVYPLSNNTWTETNVTWNSIGGYNTSVNFGASMTNNQWTAFNITNLVKGWKNGTYDEDAGFIFVNSNESNDECFCSSEHSTSSYRPYVVVTYNSPGYGGGNSFDNAGSLSLNTSVAVKIAYSGEKRYFTYTPASTGFYSFESMSISSGDPVGTLYNLNRQSIAYNNNYSGNNFKITYHLISGVQYYFTSGCNSTGTGIYSVKFYAETNPSAIAISSNVSVENSYYVSNNISYQPKYYRITPTVTSEYLFYSFNQSNDPQIWIYNSNLTQVGTDDDLGGNSNFRLNATLNTGQTYYIVSANYRPKIGTYTMGIGMLADIPTDDYYIKNIGSGLNVDIHGPYEQEFVHQWSFHTDDQEDWKIQKQVDGYYTIQSEFGANKYIGVSSTSIGSDNIKLYTSISDSTRWKIYITYDGNLFLEPKNGKGKTIYAPNTTLGTELQLEYISSSVSNRNKWIFEVKSTTPLEGQRWDQWCWAASARMMVNNYYAIPDERTQNEAVNAVKGSVIDEPANVSETAKAGKYYRSASTWINELNLTSSYWTIYSEDTLRRFIDDGNAVVILRGWYPNGVNRDGGHFTCIVGYTTVFVDGELQYRYYLYNPWPNPKPTPWDSPIITTGQVFIVSYEWICNGQNALSEKDWAPDKGAWDGVVVVNTSYASNTISPVVG